MRSGIYSVQDDRDVGKEFGDNVECACRYTVSAIDKQKAKVVTTAYPIRYRG
jgi:hypothetical protein